jgi:hypothetical protein
MFNLKKGELEMKELSIKVVVSEEKYNEMIENLKIVSGWDSKEELEVYISSGLENEIENNVYGFLFD